MSQLFPHMKYERECSGIVCGIDEAGRGPLAGPVYAAAVILSSDTDNLALQDSKKLSALQRHQLAVAIKEQAVYGIGYASVKEIDELNILRATLLAMQRAFKALPLIPDFALIDGNHPPDLPCTMRMIIRGDTQSRSIAAASILAKTARDDYMNSLHTTFPDYGFNRHKGYGTAHHRAMLQQYGATCHHRQSFRPVREALQSQVGAA